MNAPLPPQVQKRIPLSPPLKKRGVFTVVYSRNPFNPALDRSISTRTRRVRISALAPKTTLPFICLVNGNPVLRADWGKRPQHGDIVVFVTRPQGGGGGGSNPLQTVAMIALMVYAGPAAYAMFGAAGQTAAAFAATGLGMATTAGVMMAGSMLINAVLPPPRPPSPQMSAALAAPSPTYSLGAQGNSARLGSAIPVQYGRHIAFPDYAADPYAEFVGNEQFLYQLFVLGQGAYDIEAIRIEDTPVASFEEITYEVVGPGGTVTLFPANVASSIEVAGQEALTDTWLGPFIVNASGTLANYLGVDVVCPKGVYYANDGGGLDNKSVSFTVEAQTVDANGTPYGNWVALGSETITAATNTAQRRSYRYAVSQARYQVRLKRTDTKDTSSRAGHDLHWAGLRAYLPGSQQYGNVTVIAMRMRASNSLSAQASRKVNVISTRKLQAWNPTTGWGAAAATRSIAWAFADACRADYGGKLADALVPLEQLYALNAIWAARGDTFDGRFDNTLTLWEALTQIARVGRAKCYQQGGAVQIVRDQAQTVPVAMFSPRNTARGSLKVDYLMPTAETADAVTVQYFDAATWRPAEVTAALPGSTSSNPAKVQLFGCTSRDQAWREGMYMAACNRYRRRPMTFSTEMEGFIPTFGDLVAISSERLTRAQAGEVTGWDAGTLTLTLSEPLTWTPNLTHYFGLRKRDGSFSGPWQATAGADEFHAVLAELPDITPYTGSNEERTHFTFGIGTAYRQLAIVTSCKPRGMHQVEIALVNEDALVHQADTGNVPAPPAAWQLPKVPTVPAVTGLNVVQGGTPDKPVLAVSWQPAAGADHYLVEQSADGVVWTGAGNPTTSSLVIPVAVGPIQIRVFGVGITRGAPAYWNGTAGAALAPPSDVSGLALAEAFTGPVCNIKWNATARAIGYTVEVWAASTLRRTRSTVTPAFSYSAADAKADGGPWRDLTFKVRATGTGTTSAGWAELAVNNPQMGQMNNVAATGLLASIMVEYPRPAEVDFEGIRVWVSTTNGFTPSEANLKYDGPNNLINIDLDPGNNTYYVKVAGYDAWGKDSLAISGQTTVVTSLILSTHIDDASISTPKLAANAVTAEKIAANTITANKMNVSDLSAITANLGTVTSGRVQNSGNTNYMNLDATGAQTFLKVGDKVTVDAAGNATFDGVVLSRNLVAASGTQSAGTYNITAADGWIAVATFEIDTGLATNAWGASNAAYIAAAGAAASGGGIYVTYSGGAPTGDVANWGANIDRIYTRSRWSVTATIRLSVTLYAQVYNSNGSSIISITFVSGVAWKVYQVT